MKQGHKGSTRSFSRPELTAIGLAVPVAETFAEITVFLLRLKLFLIEIVAADLKRVPLAGVHPTPHLAWRITSVCLSWRTNAL